MLACTKKVMIPPGGSIAVAAAGIYMHFVALLMSTK
jgi:hypothetical protein